MSDTAPARLRSSGRQHRPRRRRGGLPARSGRCWDAVCGAFPMASPARAACGSASSIRCCAPAHSCGRTRAARCARRRAFRCCACRGGCRRRCSFRRTRLCARGARVLSRFRRGAPAGRHRRRHSLPGLPADADERDLRLLHARDVASIEPAYEAAMGREVEAICRHIPHQDLCIQWDVCHDMIVWDGQPQDQFPLVNASKADITARFTHLRDAAGRCRNGFHLCYGDFGGKHFFDPLTARHIVDISNAIAGVGQTPDRLYPFAGAAAAGDR